MSKLSLKPTTNEVEESSTEVTDVEGTAEVVTAVDPTESKVDDSDEELTAEEKEVLEANTESSDSVNKSRLNKAVEYVSEKYNLSSDYYVVSYTEKKNSVIVCVEDGNTSLKVEINNPYDVGIYSLY